MKKISVFLFTAVLIIAFTACTGAKKSDAPVENPAANDSIEQAAASEPSEPAAPVLSPTEMLKEFQAYAKAYGEAFNNISKDPKKYTELSGQSQKRVTEMEQIKGELNARQLQDYQKARDLVIKINNGGK